MCAAGSRIVFSSVQVKICKQACLGGGEHFFLKESKKERKTPDVNRLLHAYALIERHFYALLTLNNSTFVYRKHHLTDVDTSKFGF